MHAESKVSNNVSKSSVSQVREVATSRSVDRSNIITSSSNDHNKKTLFVFDNSGGRKTKHNDFTPDYDVEYDVVKSVGEEYTAMASESMDHMPKNVMQITHDGLPGFPPPHGLVTDFNANVELAADGAGFIIESPQQSVMTHESVANSRKNNEIIPKPSANIDTKFKLKPNRPKTMVKLPINSVKTEPKRVPMFVDPLLESDSNIKNSQRKAAEPVRDENKIAIPIRRLSRIPVNNEKRPINSPIETSASMNIALPSLESAIRLLGLTNEFSYPIEYGPGVQPSIHKIPLSMRRFLSPTNERQESVAINKYESKIRSKRESEKSSAFNVKSDIRKKLIQHILESLQTNNSTHSRHAFPKVFKFNQNKESEPNAEASRYMPFDERSFMTEDREDSDNDDSEGTTNENTSPFVNFDDVDKGFPSVLSSARHPKHKDQNYSPDESRKQNKYGILGSGNFEIIRGGIYSDDDSASNKVPNYVHENSEQNDRKSDDVAHHYSPNRESNNEEDSESNRFGPFNVDFFTGSPVLGFQGYDNFGATSIDKYKAPTPQRSSIKLRGQRRHFYDSHSAASNLFTITTDKDLDFDS
jgi:hypothetical protein